MLKLNPTESVIRVNAKLVAAALPFAAVNDLRDYLCGVHIRPAADGGVLIVATDGAALVCIRDKEGIAERSVTLPGSIRSQKLRANDTIRLTKDGLIWAADWQNQPAWVSPDPEIAKPFPDFKSVFAPLSEYTEGLVGEHALPLLDRVKALSKYESGIRFFHRRITGDGKAETLFTVGPRMFGLVMPMNSGATTLADLLPSEFRRAAPAGEG